LNNVLRELNDAETEIKQFSSAVQESNFKQISDKVINQLETIGATCIGLATSNATSEDMKEFCDEFIILGKVYDLLQHFHTEAETEIKNVLDSCQEVAGIGFIFRLGMMIENGIFQSDDPSEQGYERISKRIVADFPQFGDVVTMLWNTRLERDHLDVDKCLENMSHNKYIKTTQKTKDLEYNNNSLRKCYEEYQDEYLNFRADYISGTKETQELVQEVKSDLEKLEGIGIDSWHKIRPKIPKTLAGIYSFLTIVRSGESFNNLELSKEDNVEQEDVLFTPHTIQILTVLCLMGCGDSNETLYNHLMQINTGEGKSIILGAMATIFGLLGFNVRCVCYSQ